jgi:ATP-dependent Clp protease ATP-binding subunit ClpA
VGCGVLISDSIIASSGLLAELESGGRMIDAILTNTLLPRISQEFLLKMMAGEAIERVHISVQGGEFGFSFDKLEE